MAKKKERTKYRQKDELYISLACVPTNMPVFYLFFLFYDLIITVTNRVMRVSPCFGLLLLFILATEDARGSFVAIFF